jgi:hypothetical protein
MSTFAELPAKERANFVREASARLDVLPVIVEKDFWVCWMLQQIFQSSQARHTSGFQRWHFVVQSVWRD